jgi:hypothetical protein
MKAKISVLAVWVCFVLRLQRKAKIAIIIFVISVLAVWVCVVLRAGCVSGLA